MTASHAIAFAQSEAQARARLPTLAKGSIPYAGDPRIACAPGRRPTEEERWIVLYAAAVMRRRGLLPDDAGAIDGTIAGARTVVFVTADAEQREICRMRVPRDQS